MINEKMLQTKNDFNHFTYSLMNRIINRGEPIKVKLRNGSYQDILILYQDSEDEYYSEPYFFAGDHEYIWNADGSSRDNYELDMIEF